jgi:hypothetical protein
MKQTIEIDIPEGYKPEAILTPVRVPDDLTLNVRIRLQPIEKWRVPTKLDLINRDSIPCRVRNQAGPHWPWAHDTLIAISSAGQFLYETKEDSWRYCEIRDTEPKPEECWFVIKNGIKRSHFPNIVEATHFAGQIGGTISHFIEVR